MTAPITTLGRGPGRFAPEAERVVDLLNSLGSSIFRQLLWQKASGLDLTFAQSQVLSYVGQHPGRHMGEAARAFGVTLPAITHIVDRLEQKRLLIRADDPGDRRTYALSLTRAGRALAAELQAIRLRGMAGVLARMSGGDRRCLRRGLEALVGAAGRAPDGGATSRPRARSRA